MTMDFTYDGAPDEHVLNVANGNGYAIQQMLQIDEADIDYCGSMDPLVMLGRLAVVAPKDHTRPTTDNHGVAISADGVRPVCRVIQHGLTERQVQRYVEQLRLIASAAEDLGERVTWG